MRPIGWMGVLAVSGAVALAGCGGGGSSGSSSGGGSGSSGSSSSGSSSSSSSGGGEKLSLAADPGGALKFDKKTLQAKAGKVTIAFANSSGIPHAVTIQGHGVKQQTKIITKGSSSLTASLKPGRYVFYCPVDGHRAAGMQGVLVVK